MRGMAKAFMPLPILLAIALGGLLWSRVADPSSASGTVASDSTPAVDYGDSDSDGIPNFMLLESSDGEAFRRWFTFLAEAAFYQGPEVRPAEINDCAALLRFAFREAFRKHDGAWASGLRLPVPPALPAILKYQYPHTPLGANLYRIRAGGFLPEDLRDGSFAQFADAKTLRLYNTRLVSRDIRAALPGDLLFYHQEEQRMPDHAMVYVGPSHFEGGATHWIVYHTGPDGTDKGEIRRPSLEELMNHREPRWHPVAANPRFLGVYRWRIVQ
jgi:uncharacterized protein YfaT (DUF1175 family)